MYGMSSGAPQGSRPGTIRNAFLRPALFALAILPLLAAVVAASAPDASHAAPSLDSEEQAFLTLINEYRAQNGKPALVTDDRLNASADWFATDMATDNYWAQNHYDNEDPPRSPGQRAAAFGFNAPVGENLAGGYITAAQVLEGWQGSYWHNQNMLKAEYVVIGIGRASNPNSQFGWYWVTDFAVYIPPPTSTTAPTNTPAPTATPSPTIGPASPTPVQTQSPQPTAAGDPEWGDMDCDGNVGPVDAVRILRLDAGLFTSTSPPCPAMGAQIVINGHSFTWGDADCSGSADPIDATIVLRFDAGLNPDLGPGCPPLGLPV
jgi:uncharacterized protein YkwD